MFVIADFIGEDVIEVAPNGWLVDETHCYWPPRKYSKDTSSLIKREIGPGETWPMFPITIIGKAGMHITIFFADVLHIVQLSMNFMVSHSFIL